jgi:hypothetical protein
LVKLSERIALSLHRSALAILAFGTGCRERATRLCFAIKSAAIRPVIDLARFRKALAVVLLLLVPIFIGVGFAVQTVDVLDGSRAAILWFGASAFLAAILIFIWEEVVAIPGWDRALVTLLLQAFIVNLFYQGAVWAKDEAVKASNREISGAVRLGREEGLYAAWLKSQQHPQLASNGSQPVTIVKPKAQIKPDIAMALLYPEEFAVVILNRSSVLLDKPKWSFAIWDLDKPDSAGRPSVLPIPTAEGDWVRGHEALGPMSAIAQVETLIKPGDRLFGYITVLCPECLRDRAYWIYATFKQGGWFSEVKTGFPDLSLIARNLATIQANPDGFFSAVPQSDRIPIYGSMRDIPAP